MKTYKCTNDKCENIVYTKGFFCSPRCHYEWRKQHGIKCEIIGCDEPGDRKTVFGRNGYLCKKHSHLGHDIPEQ